MPHVKTICSFASLLFFPQDIKGIVFCIVNPAARTEINLETKGRSKPHDRAHLLQTPEMEKKEEISVSRKQTTERFWRQDAKRWVLCTIYLVCVTSFLSLNINKPFVCSQLCIFVHHMMYFWGLCLHWATQPICEAKWEQIMMASVPISLGIFLCCLLIGKSSNTWLNHHLWNTAEKEVIKQ